MREAAIHFAAVDPTSEAALTALRHYFAELDTRFSSGFHAEETDAWALSSFDEPHGQFLLASFEGQVLACGGLTRHDQNTAEIKRMWVAAEWRGHGVGKRMLQALEDAAAGLGYSRVVLDTNSALTEAISMYERSGYHAIERYNDNPYAYHWFAKDLS